MVWNIVFKKYSKVGYSVFGKLKEFLKKNFDLFKNFKR